MSVLTSLLRKDIRNATHSLSPALLLGIPLILILGFGNEIEADQNLSWRSVFWMSFFFSSCSLFFRSFGYEHQSSCFHIYSTLKVARWKIFWSQSFIHFLSCSTLGFAYLFLVSLFWSPRDIQFFEFSCLIFGISLCLAPIGTLLGLLLQWEREFLFALFFLPLATPLVLGAHQLSIDLNSSWLYIGGIFMVCGAFLSALLFEFFFDELSQSH